MKFFLTLSLASLTSLSGHAADTQYSGQISVAECVADGTNRYQPDSCVSKTVRGNSSCTVVLSSRGGSPERVAVSAQAWADRGDSQRPTLRGKVNYYRESRPDLNMRSSNITDLGYLISGILSTRIKTSGPDGFAKEAEIYINHDPRGERYARYRCSGLRPIL